ncbi:unnamed protein product [Dibothriocephalus latus]|uniref:Uncharacterized protein n=1 Tax=Dibothriocephalus latus TaxID=60516 RepID=A0A3P7LSS2_DIBLA|nr:unnamed protein product [Dibothriocephalus latus]
MNLPPADGAYCPFALMVGLWRLLNKSHDILEDTGRLNVCFREDSSENWAGGSICFEQPLQTGFSAEEVLAWQTVWLFTSAPANVAPQGLQESFNICCHCSMTYVADSTTSINTTKGIFAERENGID